MPPGKPTTLSRARGIAKRARSPEGVIADKEDVAQTMQISNGPAKRAKTDLSIIAVLPTRITITDKNGAGKNATSTNEPTFRVSYTTEQSVAPRFTGKFDIYSMRLSFLSNEYLPSGTLTPQYEALYETILHYQAKLDRTARILLPNSTYSGSFECTTMCDPFEDTPFDVSIDYITRHDVLEFTDEELEGFVDSSSTNDGGPGIAGVTGLPDGGCGIECASGVFKMKRAWSKAGAGFSGELAEIFEGYFSLDVKCSGMYRKGFGSGEHHKIPFWAVRARKSSAGQEIGLGPRY